MLSPTQLSSRNNSKISYKVFDYVTFLEIGDADKFQFKAKNAKKKKKTDKNDEAFAVFSPFCSHINLLIW